MSRVSMNCYAASKHPLGNNGTVARTQSKEKPKVNKHAYNYGDIETSVSLDKYNGKMMFSIWGLYNRNSPHNFKKQNTESTSAAKEQDALMTDVKYKSHLVQLTIPTLSNGVVSVETNLEVKKPKTTVEKLESLYIISSPV